MGWASDVFRCGVVFVLAGADGETVAALLRRWKYANLPLVRSEGGSYLNGVKGVGDSLSFTMELLSIDGIAERLATNVVALANGPLDRPWYTQEVVGSNPIRCTKSRVARLRSSEEPQGR